MVIQLLVSTVDLPDVDVHMLDDTHIETLLSVDGTQVSFTGRLRDFQQFLANWDTLVTRLANELEDRGDG